MFELKKKHKILIKAESSQDKCHEAVYTRSLIEVSLDPLVTISKEGKITDVIKLTENTQGTGPGLYLVKKLAKEYLGGDVGVESEYGKGSKFTLRIPVKLEEKV